jgi:O-antigen/teichoic acid export membrane protein
MSVIFKGTGILSVGDLVSRIFEVLRIVFITHLFTVQEFGLFSLAIGTVLILTGFTLPSYPSVILQYFPYYQKKGKKHASQFFSSSVLLLVINSLILIGLMMGIAEWVGSVYYEKPEVVEFIRLGAALLGISALANNLHQFLLSHEKFFTIFWGRILSSFTNLGLVVGLTYSGWEISGLIVAYIAAESVRALIGLVALREFWVWTVPRLERKVWIFWRPLIATSFFKVFTTNLPLIIIGRFLDTFFIGLYNIAEKTIKLIHSFIDPYIDTLKAVTIRTAHKSHKAFLEMLNQHNRFTLFASTLITSLAILFAPLVFMILYGNEYNQAIPYFQVFALAGMFGLVNLSFPRVVYSVTNKNHYYFWSTVAFTLVQAITMIWFTSAYGLWGLMIAHLISKSFSLGVNTYLCRRAEPGFEMKIVWVPLFAYVLLFEVGMLGVLREEWSIMWGTLMLTVLFMWGLHQSRYLNFPELMKELWKTGKGMLAGRR